MHGRQHEQRTKHDGNQTDTDDGTRFESHREDEHQHHDDDRFEQIDHECAECIFHTLWLVEHFDEFHTHWHRLLQVANQFLHLLTHLCHVLVGHTGNRHAQSSLTIVEHLVAGRGGIVLIHTGYIADAQLLLVVSLNEHV